jgi:hypothetical protein
LPLLAKLPDTAIQYTINKTTKIVFNIGKRYMPFNSVTACVVSSMIMIAVAIACLEKQMTPAQIRAATKQMIAAAMK